MLEPAPRKIPLPEVEPLIRVGIILPEDQLTEISIGSSEAFFLNDKLISTQKLQISLNANGLLECEGLTASELIIKPQDATGLQPQKGLTVSPVIAGRNFHWRKKISATYPGKLTVSSEGGFIKLINTLPFEQYLTCVATSEMSSECPLEFMKAQIIAARSWALVFLNDKHPESGFDVCNDDDCQRYQGTTFLSQNAVDAGRQSAGMFLVSGNDGTVLPAYYIKTCGGISENTKEIFGFEEDSLISISDSEKELPKMSLDDFLAINPSATYCGQADSLQIEKYLGKVDSGGSHFRWTKKILAGDLRKNIAEKLGIDDFKEATQIREISRSISFRITAIELRYKNSLNQDKSVTIESQYKIREILSPSFLPSSAFRHEINQHGDITFHGAGWGHGVGLCQVGGVVMALKGHPSEKILLHYFPKARIARAYS